MPARLCVCAGARVRRQGNGGAQYNLGVLFERGEGVPKDLRQAVVWYSKAAEQGVPGAQ